MKTPLRHLAQARAGDKGTILTLSVRAVHPSFWRAIRRAVTPEVVAEHLGDRFVSVMRHELPSLDTLLFTCRRRPGDSVTESLWLDAHGKAISSVLLDLDIEADMTALAVASHDGVPVVTTADGGVRGRRLANGVLCYSGIPFAAPPIGRWRFRPPQPAAAWRGVLDGTQWPAWPMQALTSQGAWLSEDCLYLNVWTPSPFGKRPVIVWMPGGGFENGAASPPYTDGANLAARNAVVVTANHRLGALGFAHLADLGGSEWAESTNLGLQDLAAALRWVRTNIGSFGGDPTNVTVMGQSSGAFSIGALFAMPSAQGLFEKAMLLSGSTSRTYSRDVANAMAEELLARVGASTPEGLITASADRLVAAQRAVIDTDIGRRNTPGGRAWGTVVDGLIVREEPHDVVTRGDVAHMPMVVGATRDEVDLFVLLQPESFASITEGDVLEEMRRCVGQRAEALLAAYRSENPDEDVAIGSLRSRFLTDWIYRVPAQRLASAQVAAGGAAWSCLFSWGTPEVGPFHGLDVPFWLDQLSGPMVADPGATAIRDEAIEAVLSFARTGDPGWPRHDITADAVTRDFGGSSDLVVEPPPGTRRLWEL